MLHALSLLHELSVLQPESPLLFFLLPPMLVIMFTLSWNRFNKSGTTMLRDLNPRPCRRGAVAETKDPS
jgi:hypothetical protein